MTLQPGTRLGPYEIVAPLGAGGMGEVYRAKDTKLGRDVALKILPASFTNDPERVGRFRREAQVLASLNHPHIAQIYGLEEASSTQFLVLELVDGESLDKRVARGPIPVDEALVIAKQIAEALEAAHEKGIIHRDLKPANIALTKDGSVKVLDFGLAKAAESTSGPVDAMNSPTITSPAMMTGVGVILGTAAYMSPEQAKGRPADKRSDVWAFGCVLYEMLTGKRAFEGEDVSDTLAAVLRGEPNWTSLPADVPVPVRTLARACLQKDRQRRAVEATTAVFVLGNTASLGEQHALDRDSLGTRWRGWRVGGLVATAVVVAGLAAGGEWLATRPRAPRVMRTTITPAGAAALTISGNDRDLAITPDGTRVVYVGNNGTQLFVRSLDALEPVPILTSSGVRAPFVSPDGQWVGFHEGASLKKVAITGGPPIEVTLIDGGPRGATWTLDDTIIFATGNPTTGLQQVSANGGTPVAITKPDHAHGEIDHLWPELLPGGRAVLFTVVGQGGLDGASLAVLDLRTGTTQVVLRGGSHAQYLPSGYLVYGAAGTLRAVPFDLAHLTAHGTAVPVVPRVMVSSFGAYDFSIARDDGTLTYVDAHGTAVGGRTLVWVDRHGQEESVGVPRRLYNSPRLSPDGMRIAVAAADQETDIWTWDLRHGAPLVRLTVDPAQDMTPVWTVDGRRIIFGSDRGGVRNLWWQAADGSGAPKRLTTSANQELPSDVTPNGSDVLFTVQALDTGFDIMRMPLNGDGRPVPVLRTKANERSGVVSRDGRWLAYESDSSGSWEVYVRPYPNTETEPRQVSSGGGTRPCWARDGKELFYASLDGALMTVPVEATAAVWSNGAPGKLFDSQSPVTSPMFRSFDVSPDGRRFLLIRAARTEQMDASTNVIVVQHLDEEVKRLVPPK
jgi:serine/threonine-protein kinase